jgi:hypothetical protein
VKKGFKIMKKKGMEKKQKNSLNFYGLVVEFCTATCCQKFVYCPGG